MREPQPELIFDGANGSIVNRLSEIDWTRVIGVTDEQLEPWKEDFACDDHEGDCDRARGSNMCNTCDDIRSETFDEIFYRTTHVVVRGNVDPNVLSVARDAWLQAATDGRGKVHAGRGIDAAVAVLCAENVRIGYLDVLDGDLFLIPYDWEGCDEGGWKPSLELLVSWVKRSVNGCQVDIEREPEDIQIRGNAVASGDGELDERIAREIEADLEGGNPWAWCSVKVTVTAGGLEASNYLGACSYTDEAAFRACGYFDDMIETCAREILSNRKAEWV